jgi:putative PIN family toxin of toxin-antitoxin system
MKVVIDTNVWVSALINPNGTPARIINHPAAFDLLTSTAILTELERVLHYDRIQKRYQLTDEMISAYLLTVRLDSELVEVTQQVNAVERDPDDNRVLACAVQAGADYVVSGDPHLVDLAAYQGIPILTPSAFFAVLEQYVT